MMRLDSRCLGSWIVALSAVACTSVPTRERDAMTERDATVTADATVATDATTTPDTTTIDDRAAPPSDVSTVDDAADVADVADAADAASARDSGSDADAASSCPAGQFLCSGRCVDPQTDNSNCGACGVRCAPATNATVRCAEAVCTQSCVAGFADCDLNRSNGCETALNTTANCGACGRSCTASAPICDSRTGTCTTGCSPSQSLCSMSCVDTQSNAAHCGRCGMACAAPPNATATCSVGSCGFTCNAGFANCDGNTANGCETNTTNSASNCGRCGTVCAAAPNATGVCVSSTCRLACMGNFADCDLASANGCEVNLDNNPNHCGRCGLSCGANGACIMGSVTGTCVGCAVNTCGSYCATLATDVSNCGSCGYRCPAAPAGYTATCAAGLCSYGASCDTHMGDCDHNLTNGYETNLETSTLNCGACGVACRAGDRCCNGMCRAMAMSCFPCA